MPQSDSSALAKGEVTFLLWKIPTTKCNQRSPHQATEMNQSVECSPSCSDLRRMIQRKMHRKPQTKYENLSLLGDFGEMCNGWKYQSEKRKECYHVIPTLEFMMILSSPNIFSLIKKKIYFFFFNSTDFLGKSTNTCSLKKKENKKNMLQHESASALVRHLCLSGILCVWTLQSHLAGCTSSSHVLATLEIKR